MLFVYCIDINKKLPNVKLSKEIIEHVSQYKNQNYKKISKLAWSYLFKFLKNDFNVNWNKEKVYFNENGKPYLKTKKIYFNLSHSLNLIALAISDKPVGVDIEKIIPIKICKLVSQRILFGDEIKKYESSKDKCDYLTRIWTRKEALVKLEGSSVIKVQQHISYGAKNVSSFEVYDNLNNKYYLSVALKK